MQLWMFDVEYGLFDKICAPNFIQNTDILITLILITLGNTKDLSAQSPTITSKVVGFPTMIFYINFA